MDINFEKKIATIYNKNVKLETLLNKFSGLSGEQVYGVFGNRGIKLPRKLNCLAMIEVLNRRIKYLNSNSLSKDYFLRLQYYPSFGETQLKQLFEKLCNEDDFLQYRINLFKLILINFVSLDLNDGEISYLRNLTVTRRKIGTFSDYFDYITACSLEQEDTFDGQNVEVLKNDLINTASSQDVFDIANKYGIELPTRLDKDQFKNYIIDYLETKTLVSIPMKNKINEMTVNELEEFAKEKEVPMQTNMTKVNLVTYLFYYLTLCEIPITSINRLKYPDEFKPLEFTIDFDSIPNFPTTDSVRVIHYVGEENDKSEYEKLLEELEEKKKKEEELKLALEQEKLARQKEKEELKKREELLKEELKKQSVVDNSNNALNEIIVEDKKDFENEEILEEKKVEKEDNDSVNQSIIANEEKKTQPEVLEDIKNDEEQQLEQVVEEEVTTNKIYDKEVKKIDTKKSLLDEYLETIKEKDANKVSIDITNVQKNDQYNSKKINGLVTEKSSLIIKILIAVFFITFIGLLIYKLLK